MHLALENVGPIGPIRRGLIEARLVKMSVSCLIHLLREVIKKTLIRSGIKLGVGGGAPCLILAKIKEQNEENFGTLY